MVETIDSGWHVLFTNADSCGENAKRSSEESDYIHDRHLRLFGFESKSNPAPLRIPLAMRGQ